MITLVLNLGLTFHPYNWLSLGAGLERGNQFRLSFTLDGNFFEDTLPKPSPKIVAKLNREQQKRTLENKDVFYRSLNRSLRSESIYLQAADYDENKVDVSIASSKYFGVMLNT